MKIAFLIGEIGPNKGQTHGIAEIIKYLHSKHQDWEISLLTPKVQYPLVDAMSYDGINIKKIEQYYSSMFLRKRMSEMLRNYDILYIKGNYPYVFPAMSSGKPTILVVHQIDSPKLFNNMSQKARIIATRILTPYVLRKPTVVVTVTEELRSFYKRKYGIDSVVIEDQIPDLYFSSRKGNTIEEHGVIKLLTVGYWDGFKGRKRHEVLLKYFAAAVKSMPNSHLTMCGLSNNNLEELNKLLVEMNLLGNVSLKGYIKEDELHSIYLSNDIYVTATTFEGFYRQIVEGFATGMPAVVYDSREFTGDPSKSASVNHVLKSGAGEIYKDAETFILALKKVMLDYKDYSNKAKLYAIRFSSQVVGKKTEDLIMNAVSDRHSEKL